MRYHVNIGFLIMLLAELLGAQTYTMDKNQPSASDSNP
jgi:hypothetical protein